MTQANDLHSIMDRIRAASFGATVQQLYVGDADMQEYVMRELEFERSDVRIHKDVPPGKVWVDSVIGPPIAEGLSVVRTVLSVVPGQTGLVEEDAAIYERMRRNEARHRRAIERIQRVLDRQVYTEASLRAIEDILSDWLSEAGESRTLGAV